MTSKVRKTLTTIMLAVTVGVVAACAAGQTSGPTGNAPSSGGSASPGGAFVAAQQVSPTPSVVPTPDYQQPYGPGTPPAVSAQGYSPGPTVTPASGLGTEGPFGFGAAANSDQIAAWNIEVGPDGAGAPPGSGTVSDGAATFSAKCASCHGANGEGQGTFPALVKPFDPNAKWPQFPRTIGNYWPYATTVFDYVNRAMPFTSPNSLTANEIYGVTAWLLNKNGIVPDNATMNADTLPKVEMPARKFFIPFWPDFFRPM